MTNLIKADLYRILRSKGIYITTTILLVLFVLQAFGEIGSIGISSDEMEGATEIVKGLTGRTAPLNVMRANDNLIYFLLPIIIFISSVDFSSGTAKNVLSTGVSRTKYYFSKLILSMLFCALILISSIVIPTTIVTFMNGFGGEFDWEYISEILNVFALQLLLLFAVTSVGNFIVFTTKRTAIVNGLYIAFCLVPAILILMLYSFSEKFYKLLEYEMIMNIRTSAYVNIMAGEEIIKIIAVGFVYLIVSLVCGLVLFKKSDIK